MKNNKDDSDNKPINQNEVSGKEKPQGLKIKNLMKNPQIICGQELKGGHIIELTQDDFKRNPVFEKKVKHGIKIGVLEQV